MPGRLLDEILSGKETDTFPEREERTDMSNPTPEYYLNVSLQYHTSEDTGIPSLPAKRR